MAVPLKLAQTRLKVERWRENYRYKQWYKQYHKRPQTPVTEHERSKWWKAYTDAHAKRLSLEHEVREKTPKFKAGHELSTKGANFIKGYEGYIGHVYNDGTGVMTVGYGHTEHVPGSGVWLPHQRRRFHLTEPEASELLRRDVNKNYAPTIRNLGLRLNDNQFTALTSFVYNCGIGAVGRNTTVGRYLHQGNIHAAANAMLAWDKAGGHSLPGLTRRREAERHLLLS